MYKTLWIIGAHCFFVKKLGPVCFFSAENTVLRNAILSFISRYMLSIIRKLPQEDVKMTKNKILIRVGL